MGIISSFNLWQFIESDKVDQYVETGLGVGDCLKTAMEYPFKKIFSAELDSDLVQNSKHLEKDQRVKIIQGKSTDALKEIIPQLDTTPVLWWLDAHLPFGDFHKISYEESIRTYLQDCFPLEEEIEIIATSRNCSKDVFMIDDTLLYEKDLDCEHFRSSGDFPHRELVKSLGMSLDPQFLYNRLDKTHNWSIDLRHQGYFILTPKSC